MPNEKFTKTARIPRALYGNERHPLIPSPLRLCHNSSLSLDSPSTSLRVVSPSTLLRTVSLSNGLSNHGSRPHWAASSGMTDSANCGSVSKGEEIFSREFGSLGLWSESFTGDDRRLVCSCVQYGAKRSDSRPQFQHSPRYVCGCLGQSGPRLLCSYPHQIAASSPL